MPGVEPPKHGMPIYSRETIENYNRCLPCANTVLRVERKTPERVYLRRRREPVSRESVRACFPNNDVFKPRRKSTSRVRCEYNTVGLDAELKREMASSGVARVVSAMPRIEFLDERPCGKSVFFVYRPCSGRRKNGRHPNP